MLYHAFSSKKLDYLSFRPRSSYEDRERFLEHTQGTRTVGYSYAAALAFLVYDIILTIPDEVQYVWPNPWSISKFAFVFVRYFPPLLEVSTQFYGAPLPLRYSKRGCYVWNVYQGLASILLVAAVDYILVLRIFALYSSNIHVKTMSAILYVLEITTMCIGIGLAIPKMVFDEHCVVTSSSITMTIAGGCPIAYQVFLFALTIYKFYQSAKAGWGDVPILQLIMRDGTWAFAVLFGVLASEALLYGLSAKAYTGLLYGWVNTAFSICGYRIIININKLHHSNRRHPTGELTGPDILFTSSHVATGSSVSQLSESPGPRSISES
ncbi:hypothetical protein DFP72DRAFT_554594 [Ephemerocybe angulata]|uniref:DUF6533 domain-containing protein n=1 Tax=Ephemerocybe angulata TaxID=980116 RepID=A0A8H6HKS3_9AGAR|nr:hypothetical protein DFP72DRAFT_554594 [Tulosesus angulatus]